MLPYALAIAVGLSSLVLFLTAFLMPKIHRQDDFLWSGVGLFYALVLWFCAAKISGAVLLGQLAAVALLSSYTWQVIILRKAIANPEEHNIAESFSITGFLGGFLNRSPKSPSSETSVSQEMPASEDSNNNAPEEKLSDTVIDEVIDDTKEEVSVVNDAAPSTEQEEKVIETDNTDEIETEVQKPEVLDKEPNLSQEDSSQTTPTPQESSPLTQTKLDDIFDDDDEETTELITSQPSNPTGTTEPSTPIPQESSPLTQTKLDDIFNDDDEETTELITSQPSNPTGTTEPSTPTPQESSPLIQTKLDDIFDDDDEETTELIISQPSKPIETIETTSKTEDFLSTEATESSTPTLQEPFSFTQTKLDDIFDNEETTESITFKPSNPTETTETASKTEDSLTTEATESFTPSISEIETSNWEDDSTNWDEESIFENLTAEFPEKPKQSTLKFPSNSETIVKAESVSSASDIEDVDTVPLTAELENHQQSSETPDDETQSSSPEPKKPTDRE